MVAMNQRGHVLGPYRQVYNNGMNKKDMNERFSVVLAEGGKTNSLGRAAEVVDCVLGDQNRLEELYDCIFDDDAWVRMRAIDSFEKICRVHPEWFTEYTERLLTDVAVSSQASIQWHVAQLLGEMSLTDSQKQRAVIWLLDKGSNSQVDWIVASNVMATLAQFVRGGAVSRSQFSKVLGAQTHHRSPAVRKRAAKLRAESSD